MVKHTGNRVQMAWRLMAMVAVSLLFTACNLGQQAPSEPYEVTPAQGQPLAPLDTGLPTPTPTLMIQIPPTNTPVPELLPSEKLGPITIDGTTHRTVEPVTVRVRRGMAVSNVSCVWVLQDTNQSGQLTTPTSTQVDADTFEDVYTFTPQAAGTYSVNCNGVALTLSGQRSVNAVGTPFVVEAKG